jgi:multifunctional methyltransferase subunit TRM112
MKLLTHNMLTCHIKGVQNGYPLKIEAEQVETREADYDPGAFVAALWVMVGPKLPHSLLPPPWK